MTPCRKRCSPQPRERGVLIGWEEPWERFNLHCLFKRAGFSRVMINSSTVAVYLGLGPATPVTIQAEIELAAVDGKLRHIDSAAESRKMEIMFAVVMVF